MKITWTMMKFLFLFLELFKVTNPQGLPSYVCPPKMDNVNRWHCFSHNQWIVFSVLANSTIIVHVEARSYPHGGESRCRKWGHWRKWALLRCTFCGWLIPMWCHYVLGMIFSVTYYLKLCINTAICFFSPIMVESGTIYLCSLEFGHLKSKT